jgi:hypothetical protein
MAVYRWVLRDPFDKDPQTNSYTFPRNPEEMSSPFAERVISSSPTTYRGHVLREGSPLPKQWTFSGTIPDAEMYEALRAWVYDRHHRLWIYDHYGRRITIVLQNFDPTPKRAYGKYWKHTYSITAQVLSVGKPSVFESQRGFVVGPQIVNGSAF